ncbi:hypothetical protein [uncultured Aquimarina sp.]|uniref:hypothetical protein n=1 Tax=uncultured Aquimarina sp. TaxID=575652 RepID=UPI00263619BC|nr:hypothetical protein [uncultured Aquimarina sp.]
MSDKKNIDRLFQEKFKNFEVTPDDAVWKKIQDRKKKDRKRVLLIPFWYRIAGIAALVAVILSVGSIFLPEDSTQDSIVVTKDSENTDNLSTENQDSNTTIPDDGLVGTSKNEKSNYNDGASESSNANNEAITNSSLKNDDKKDTPFDITSDSKSTISDTYKNPSANKNTTNKESITTTNLTNTEAIVSNKDNQKKDDMLLEQKATTLNTVAETQKTSTSEINKEKVLITGTAITAKNGIAENNNATNNQSENITKKESPYFQDPSNKENTIKESIVDNQEESNNLGKEEVSDQTSDQNQGSGKKSIFEAIKEKEEKEKIIAETKSGKRWNISPNVAPVYYDSFGGSSIDAEFSDNNKQGQVNLSYGIQVAYSINKKLSVRSGVNKVDVGYNTEDVGFGISSVGRGDNNNGFTNTQSIIVSDFQATQASFTPSPPDINGEVLVKSQNPGLLNHSIGYIEVPLELKYSLTDSKIGIHMIGGVSTLFLEDEEVSIIAGSFRNENVARDETVNDISFSGNIGIGFDYKLSDQFQINMEPIFKYQFNGFKDSAENFKPYYFGIYTGISFKF